MITPAYAQTASAFGGSEMLMQVVPFILIFVIMYFLMIRPQQKRQRDQKAVVDAVKKGDKIRIGGLGILQVRKRAARMGRNPATGEAIKIKASKKVAFRAAKELKEAV